MARRSTVLCWSVLYRVGPTGRHSTAWWWLVLSTVRPWTVLCSPEPRILRRQTAASLMPVVAGTPVLLLVGNAGISLDQPFSKADLLSGVERLPDGAPDQ